VRRPSGIPHRVGWTRPMHERRRAQFLERYRDVARGEQAVFGELERLHRTTRQSCQAKHICQAVPTLSRSGFFVAQRCSRWLAPPLLTGETATGTQLRSGERRQRGRRAPARRILSQGHHHLLGLNHDAPELGHDHDPRIVDDDSLDQVLELRRAISGSLVTSVRQLLASSRTSTAGAVVFVSFDSRFRSST
jgi:hypothetical protein